MRGLALAVLLLALGCGVKAPPRPPAPERAPAADGGAPAAASPCESDGGPCGR